MQKNYLIQHALETEWCSPRADNQWVYAPVRVSPKEGCLNYGKILGRMIEMPDRGRRFHVFQMGQQDPNFVGLMRQIPVWNGETWFKTSDAMKTANMEITIYNANGINLPRTDSYYMFTEERCLIFIVPYNSLFPVDYENEQIYFRFYTNPYFKQNNGNDVLKIDVGMFQPRSTNEILDIERKIAEMKNLPGLVRCYANGIIVDNFNFGNIKQGDYLEYVYDGSVKKVLKWRMAQLFNFRSELDGVYKYLLHYPGDNNWQIDFEDDIDVGIMFSTQGQYRRGVYYNRNFAKNHRMITHKDYAVDANMAMLLRDSLSDILKLETIPVEETFIELVIRHSAQSPHIHFENQRIKELYKLPDGPLYEAMIGLNALVPEWYCVNLEKSASIEMMRRPWAEFDLDLIEKGYGYNAIGKIVADTPTKMVSTGTLYSAPLAPGLQEMSTIYEFDKDGLLLGWHIHTNGDVYQARSPLCRMIEGVMGVGDDTGNSIYGQDNIPIVTGWEHRVYRCYLQDGIPNNEWEDITGTNLYAVENGKVVWKSTPGYHWLCVRCDNKFVAYDVEHSFNSGMLNFTIMENPTGNPMDDMEPIAVPYAQLDIWMNGYKLIRWLDYFVKGPQVYITNKTFLLAGGTAVPQKFHIRASRLDEGLKGLDPVDDFGWVYHGSLSNNDIYDIRDDRVLQINLGGMIQHREDLTFSEDRPQPAIIHKYNGFPYQIKDLIVPFNSFTDKSPYELRKSSQVIDKAVSDYLTEFYGQMTPDGVSSIGPRYPVVSPFLAHILYLLINGMMPIPEDRIPGDLEVQEICQPHEFLLQYDPMNGTHQPDIRYAFTVPHYSNDTQVLDFIAYRFFTRVVELYGYPGLVTKGYIAIRQY